MYVSRWKIESGYLTCNVSIVEKFSPLFKIFIGRKEKTTLDLLDKNMNNSPLKYEIFIRYVPTSEIIVYAGDYIFEADATKESIEILSCFLKDSSDLIQINISEVSTI